MGEGQGRLRFGCRPVCSRRNGYPGRPAIYAPSSPVSRFLPQCIRHLCIRGHGHDTQSRRIGGPDGSGAAEEIAAGSRAGGVVRNL